MADLPLTNPFLQPGWLLSWARPRVADGDFRVVTVRDGEDLVTVAPFALHRRLGSRVLSPLGCGRGRDLTEVPGIVTLPGRASRTLPAVIGALAAEAGEWDWAHVALGPGDGWLQPHWPMRRPDGRR